MNQFSRSLFAIVAVLSMVGCGNPVQDATDAIKKASERAKKESQKNDPFTFMNEGGQPTPISVSGIIVKNDKDLDVRIKAESRGGLGKNGARVKVGKNYLPKLSSQTKTNLDQQVIDDSLIAIGTCDSRTIAKLAEERSLKVKPMPKPKSEDDYTFSVSANTIIMCGNPTEITSPAVYIHSNDLILMDANYSVSGFLRIVELATNRLVLVGKNALSLVGADGLGLLPAGGLTLSVAKAIDGKGQLLLNATGASYKAKAKN